MNWFVWLQHPYLTTLVRGLLALVFLVSARDKLRAPRQFVAVVLSYKVLPTPWARVFARVLPWVEAAVGLMLLLGLETRIGAALGGLLFFSFLIAMGINVARGRTDLDCGCFGARHHEKVGVPALLRDAALLLLSLQVALWGGGILTLDSWLSSEPGRPDYSAPVEYVLPLISIVIGVAMINQLRRHMIGLLRMRGQQ